MQRHGRQVAAAARIFELEGGRANRRFKRVVYRGLLLCEERRLEKACRIKLYAARAQQQSRQQNDKSFRRCTRLPRRYCLVSQYAHIITHLRSMSTKVRCRAPCGREEFKPVDESKCLFGTEGKQAYFHLRKILEVIVKNL